MKRRVAIISESASPLGGVGGKECTSQQLYLGQLARRLASQGYEVDIFTRKDQQTLPEIVEWESGVRVIHVPAGPAAYVRKESLFLYMEEFIRSILDFCSAQYAPYDVAHATHWISGLAAMAMKRLLKIPFVLTFHTLGRIRRLYQGRGAPGGPGIEQEVIAEAERIVAECPRDRQDLIKFFRADPDKVTLIPCGFNLGTQGIGLDGQPLTWESVTDAVAALYEAVLKHIRIDPSLAVGQ